MQDLEMNPYVIQIDKFVNSLGKLSRVFLDLEEGIGQLTKEEYKGMCEEVGERVCKSCGHKDYALPGIPYGFTSTLCCADEQCNGDKYGGRNGF